ncbi:hypothetical protein GCM10011494_03910 [Novosphingobium endophyticum]|uniref:Transporter n=1 Tax=Novosphingobium endophyticum TaxID=1955250 RepID=A0A916TP03_9SPHN|nr:transporter [Novosphingobium endophyticum]GGB88825.1 hypothetical protein GCM10011494_03910 [Novosphingobium endophyticum]
MRQRFHAAASSPGIKGVTNMERNAQGLSRACLLPVAVVLSMTAAEAHAQDVTIEASAEQRLEMLEMHLQQQQTEIDALKRLLREQDDALAIVRGLGTGAQDQPVLPRQVQAAAAAPPAAPVGEAPPSESRKEQVRAQVQAVPEGQGVLTPRGMLNLEPSITYVQSSTDRLVFRGIELVPGIQIGLIEASSADRNTILATSTMRYGLTNRLEAEVRIPFVYRHDTVEFVQQRDEGIVRTLKFEETDIGDVEFALRYQLNNPKRGQQPIFVGSIRVKSDTGIGPFDIDYDEFGIATDVATGSGFWSVQPGLSFLLPSDPVVIYGSANYLFNIARDIDQTIGGASVGRVDPGDAITGNLGFGFALNPRFSFSLGYEHAYIFPTKTEIGDTLQKSRRLQVGSFSFGMSYRLSEEQSMNWSFQFGATKDAPNVAVTLRLPLNVGF